MCMQLEKQLSYTPYLTLKENYTHEILDIKFYKNEQGCVATFHSSS